MSSGKASSIPRRRRRPASIKEIARLAGVSIGTIDRVVHNRGRVAKETEKKVRRIIAETGYRPNLFASRLSRGKSFRFAVWMPRPGQDSGFWKLPLQGIGLAARELRSQGVDVATHFFDKYATSAGGMERGWRAMMAEKPDGLLLAPVVPGPMKECLKRIPPGFPYVFFDTNLPDASPISVIIQDSYQSGVVSAKLMHLLAGKNAEIAVLQLEPADFHLSERERGFRDYMLGIPDVTCRPARIDGSRIRESIQQTLGALLRTHPQLRGAFVTNASTFQAAAFLQSRQAHGERIPVIGYDLIPENARLLAAGCIDFIINPRPELQGYRGIYTLYRSQVLREQVPPCQMMPIDIVTRENLVYAHSQEEQHEKARSGLLHRP